jgi:hypothetical protein
MSEVTTSKSVFGPPITMGNLDTSVRVDETDYPSVFEQVLGASGVRKVSLELIGAILGKLDPRFILKIALNGNNPSDDLVVAVTNAFHEIASEESSHHVLYGDTFPRIVE